MSLDELLKQLKNEYVESLPERLDGIEKLSQTEPLPWKELETEFHKLKGTGKTYGFPEVSELSALLEISCSQKEKPEAIGYYVKIMRKLVEDEKTQKCVDLTDNQDYEKLKSLLT